MQNIYVTSGRVVGKLFSAGAAANIVKGLGLVLAAAGFSIAVRRRLADVGREGMYDPLTAWRRHPRYRRSRAIRDLDLLSFFG